MDLRNVKKIKIGNAELKTLGINGKVAWQGLPEFYVGDTQYNPNTFPFWLPITNDANVVFTNFDSSSYKLTAYLVGGGGGGASMWGYVSSSQGGNINREQSGGGGAGGEVITATPSIAENVNYPISIGSGGTKGVANIITDLGGYNYHVNTTAPTSGGDTTAFGYTAKGGTKAQSVNNGQTTNNYIPQGGSGTNMASGGKGSSNQNPSTNPTVGATGTTVNGTIYGSGGSGGGFVSRVGYYTGYGINWTTTTVANADNTDGHGNYGSGGNGGAGTVANCPNYSGGVSVNREAEDGKNGIVILKIEEI